MDRKDFYYELPPELIAQDPLPDRSSSRMMKIDKRSGQVQHLVFTDITRFLKKGDCLVINDTKVIPARLLGVKEATGGGVEVLLLRRGEGDIWQTLLRPAKRLKPGARIIFGDGRLIGEVAGEVDDGVRLVRFRYEGIFEEILDELGQMPLPPYIKHSLKDADRYQTVYAKHAGSAAAPTAGLHFTKELLSSIAAMGVDIVTVTLHVGLGTFRPVKEDDITKHPMHSEYYHVDADAARRINDAKEKGGRVICVGTTSVRTLETAADESGRVKASSGETDIFIYPGYRFKITDGLVTNFHLPESTLLMLVSAFAGREHILAAYRKAIREKYRFYSFGDCCLII